MTRKTLPAKILFCALAAGVLLAGRAGAQEGTNPPAANAAPSVRRNSPYSPNPKRKTPPNAAAAQKTQTPGTKTGPANAQTSGAPKEGAAAAAAVPAVKNAGQPGGESTASGETGAENKTQPDADATAGDAENVQFQTAEFESRSSAKKTFDVAKRAASAALAPTEIYKVGAGDVLFINLQNAPVKESLYFTVLKDGTIDYPLAGGMVSVLGLTTDEIQDVLQDKIKLFESPQVAVKVREHNSHAYTVLGMVEKSGEKYLQREAVPLFVVKAESIVQQRANRVVIKRANSQTETLDLRDRKTDDVLVFPGDIIEFDSAEAGNAFGGQPQFYYIGGQVAAAGQKDFYKGITLTQAILVAGGLKKSGVKSVVIRRKNEAGLLAAQNFDLKAIKEGKLPDPLLEAGDTVEVGN